VGVDSGVRSLLDPGAPARGVGEGQRASRNPLPTQREAQKTPSYTNAEPNETAVAPTDAATESLV
jgi:hypothetical protein